MENVIEIIIVCENRLFRESLACTLSQSTLMNVSCHSDKACEALQRMAEVNPDVIITDFSSLMRTQLGNIQQLREVYPEAKLLVIGLQEFESELLECIELGALGCLSISASLEELHYHIRTLAVGGALCSPDITKFLFSLMVENAGERERLEGLDLTDLTRREREILALIEEGLSNKEIAISLKIELQTVKNHVHNLLAKLQLSNRREAAKFAREKGWMRS